LACVLIGLHYHSFEASDLHAQMIISATFGGYIIILAGIFAGILAGQPVPRRVVSSNHIYFIAMKNKYRNFLNEKLQE